MSDTNDNQDYTQPIETNNGKRIVRHKTHIVLAGEQRYDTTTACIEGLQQTAQLSKGYMLLKRQPEDKTVYHLNTKLTGLIENRGEGQIVTNSPITPLPLAQGYEVDDLGNIKQNTEGQDILGPVPSFTKIVISGLTTPTGCNCDETSDGSVSSDTEDPRWFFLNAPRSSSPVSLMADNGEWVFGNPVDNVEYYTEGTAFDFRENFPDGLNPFWLLPATETDTQVTIQVEDYQLVRFNNVALTSPDGLYTFDADKVMVIADQQDGSTYRYSVYSVAGVAGTGTATPAEETVLDFTANTGVISEVLFNENVLYVLNRQSSNTSDLTLTRGSNYGAYEIRTSFTKLDTNTVSIPAGTDVALYVSGGEIKIVSLGDQESSSNSSFQVGNVFHWHRTDTPPADRLIPISGQTVSNVDIDYPELWNDRNFIASIASFNDTAKTITMKNYNGDGRFLRGGLSVGVEQNAGTALPTIAFTGTTNNTGSHVHGIQQGPDTDSNQFASPDALNATGTSIDTLPAGAHEHTVSIDAGGDDETRPVNTATLLCIIANPF